MKNPLVIVVIIIVVALGGFSVYALSQNASQSDSMVKKDQVMMQKEDTAMKPTSAMMENKMSNSRYVDYNKTAFDSASGTRRILFFYASWCPTCKPADANFKENINKIPEDVTLIRVNYNDPETDQEEKDLARTYGITYQHTFVQIDNAGKEVAKWNGGQIDELLTNIK